MEQTKKKPNPRKQELQSQYSQLQQSYNLLAMKFGDAQLKIRYWNEQIDKLTKQIDDLGDEQILLQQALEKEPNEIEESAADSERLGKPSNQTQTSS